MSFARLSGWLLLLGLSPASFAAAPASTGNANAAPAKPVHKMAASSAGIPALSTAFSVIVAEKAGSLTATQKGDFKTAIRQLKGLVHPIESGMVQGKMDSILLHLQIDPAASLQQMERLVNGGAYTQAQYTGIGMIRLCAECHAKVVQKPVWADLKAASALSEFERGQFYKTVGKENEAFLSFEKVMNNATVASTRKDIWDRATGGLVGLSIRLQDSPFTYVDIVSNVLQGTQLNPLQKELLSRWRSAGKAWDKEPRATKNPNEALQRAHLLINYARSAKDPMSAYIEIARSMNLLKTAQAGGNKAEAFLLAGQMREKVTIDGVWYNAEDYYQACIRSSPKSLEAGQCWDLLKSLPQRYRNFVMSDELGRQLQTIAR